MAGTILFESGEDWYVGVHGFYPVIDRIRLAASDEERPLVEPLFETIDQGLDCIALKGDVNPRAFNAFYRLARQEYRRSLASEADARALGLYFPGIMDGWAELIRLLEADARCLRD